MNWLSNRQNEPKRPLTEDGSRTYKPESVVGFDRSSRPPSAAGLDELTRQLQNQRSQVRDALSRLKTAAEELEDERRKWWKFW